MKKQAYNKWKNKHTTNRKSREIEEDTGSQRGMKERMEDGGRGMQFGQWGTSDDEGVNAMEGQQKEEEAKGRWGQGGDDDDGKVGGGGMGGRGRKSAPWRGDEDEWQDAEGWLRWVRDEIMAGRRMGQSLQGVAN